MNVRTYPLLAMLLLSAPVYAQSAAPAVPAAPSTAATLAETLTGDAKAAYESGKILFKDGDYDGAFLKFRAAYESSKDARLKWNMAACRKQKRYYAETMKLVREYIQESGKLISEDDRRQGEELIKTLEPFTSRVKLSVNQAGARVFVDDNQVGTTPVADPIIFDIGERKFRVVKDGYEPYEEKIIVDGKVAEMTRDIKLQVIVHEGKVTIQAPAAAMIYIDGKLVGGGKYEATLPSGAHTLRVTQTDMLPYQSDLTVEDKKARRIDVTLEPAKKGLPTWAWLTIGGLAAGAAAGVGAYFLLQPKDADPPQGSFRGFNDTGSTPLFFGR